MAKLLNPLLSTDAKGTTSGLTFRNWRGLRNVTRKAAPVKRTVLNQNINRSLMGWLSRTWSLLDAGERAGWLAWAQNHPRPDGFGGFFQMSAINAFTSLQHTAIRLGGAPAISQSAPIADLQIALASYTVVQGAASGQIDLTFTTFGTGLATDFIEVQSAGPFMGTGKTQVEGRFKLQTALHGNDVAETISSLVPGAYYWIRSRYVGADGQVSAWMYGSAIAKV